MYNCTNFDDVVYNGDAPEFMEFGPYVYREYDDYTVSKYDIAQNPATGLNESAVYANYTQNTIFVEDGDGFIDDDMYLVNPATLAGWYRLNNQPKWRTFMTLLYSVVIDTLGRQTLNFVIFNQLNDDYDNPSEINKWLMPDVQASHKIEDLMYNDPFYGLKYVNNYFHWNALLETANPEEKIAWQWELRTYFGLTSEQIDSITENYCDKYADKLKDAIEDLELQDQYENEQGAAYWQWANQLVTENNNLINKD